MVSVITMNRKRDRSDIVDLEKSEDCLFNQIGPVPFSSPPARRYAERGSMGKRSERRHLRAEVPIPGTVYTLPWRRPNCAASQGQPQEAPRGQAGPYARGI